MSFGHSRRQFLQESTALAVTAFLPGSRAWATASPVPAGAVPIPPLDGELLQSGEILNDAASDFGHIVSLQPFAVLLPGSADDIQKMVVFARDQGIKIAGMSKAGDSHSTFGQAQVEAGIVIDMSTLNRIHEINDDHAYADAGVRWLQLLEQTTPLGKTPPALTDYVGLSIGGSLSVGGIGGQSFRHGFMVDNVLELEVVTGRGQLVTCSPTERPFLFNAVRAGLGQFAVIVRARVRLIDVPPQTRTYTALYSDLSAMMSDQEMLLQDGRFDYVQGQAVANEETGSGWLYLLETVKYFEAGEPPDDSMLLSGLGFIPGTEAAVDQSFFEFANRLAPIIELLIQLGFWQLPHPWFNMFVPVPEAPSFIQNVLDQETAETIGPGSVILIYPFLKSRVGAPFMALPDSEIIYLFSLLRTAAPPTDPLDMVQRNREIYDALQPLGGKRYAISSVPFSQQDWRDNFGTKWLPFVLAKVVYDPHNVLTPGQEIFSF